MDYQIFDHPDDAKKYFGEQFKHAKQCKSCGHWAMPWNIEDDGNLNPTTELCDLCADSYWG